MTADPELFPHFGIAPKSEAAHSSMSQLERAAPAFMAAWTFSTCTTGSVSMGVGFFAGLQKICI